MKKQLLALIFSALMVVGVGSTASAATAYQPTANGVATVNVGAVFSSMPEAANIDSQMKAIIADAQKTMEKAIADKTPQDKLQALDEKLRFEIAQKQNALVAPVQAKVSQAIATVAKSHGYAVVLPSEVALYSATDITKEVLAAAK